MDNYTWPTGENLVDEPLHLIKLDENAIHMNVKTGSKVSNLISYALKNFEKSEVNQITWNGTGEALNKVVACAEIFKTRIPNLYQINKIGFQKSEEYWKSKLEDLRDIKVTKEIPKMCIILSKKPLDSNESGYQTDKILDDLYNRRSNEKSKTTKNKDSNLDNDDSVYVRKQKMKKN